MYNYIFNKFLFKKLCLMIVIFIIIIDIYNISHSVSFCLLFRNIAHKLKVLSHRLRFDDHHSSSKNAMETAGVT